jgi:hypothetical protein
MLFEEGGSYFVIRFEGKFKNHISFYFLTYPCPYFTFQSTFSLTHVHTLPDVNILIHSNLTLCHFYILMF